MLSRLLRAVARRKPDAAGLRVALLAHDHLPTLDIYFLRPLQALVDRGVAHVTVLTEGGLRRQLGERPAADITRHWTEALRAFRPDAMVFCRYNGAHAEALLAWAQDEGVPAVFHLDDDLLDVPASLGAAKHAFHNDPARLQCTRTLLDASDLVYASTSVLAERLRSHGGSAPVYVGPHALSGAALAAPRADDDQIVVGYMSGSDHRRDLALVLPALVQMLERHADARIELMGVTPAHPSLARFGPRVTRVPPVGGYGEFLSTFARRRWHVALCPLEHTRFNQAKSCIKWIDCASVGAAVVASRGTVYDGCCADGAGLLVDNEPAQWLAALEALIMSPPRRLDVARNAQRRLARDFSLASQRRQLSDMLNAAGVRSAFPIDSGAHDAGS
jgi:glycosyltransferase involved in cell wall biosynthesis